MARQPDRTFFQLVTEAINDIETHGYDSAERIAYWLDLLRGKAETTVPSVNITADRLKERLKAEYTRLVDKGGLERLGNIPLFTLERIKPALRAELDRRILASTDLIKRNRRQNIDRTLDRFAGWATSIPAGGSPNVDKKKIKEGVRKPLAQLPFEDRRLMIDQGHKLVAAIVETTAVGSNAIAAEWHSNFRQVGYNYRPDHKERDGKVYAIRGSWADERGLINAGAGYTDRITKPAEEPFCRCSCRYIYALRGLPSDMLTDKGRAELEAARARIRGVVA